MIRSVTMLGAALVATQQVPAPQIVSVPLEGRGGAALQFLRSGDDALLRITVGNRVTAQAVPSAQLVLGLLADRRAAPLWPALIDWAGPGLERLRVRDLARAREAFDAGARAPANNSAESSVRPRIRAVLQYANALARNGHLADAAALLDRERAGVDRATDWGRAEWVMLTLRLANVRSVTDNAAAIDMLASGRAEAPDNAYAINLDVNRAALLAEAGRSAESLALIDAALPQFALLADGKRANDRAKVPGSDRQFEWIRACALAGLGRRAEASQIYAQVRAAPEPHDRDFVTSSNLELQWRALRCLRDAPAAAALLAAEIKKGPIGGRAFTVLQPGIRKLGLNNPEFLAEVRRQPSLAFLAERMRELPAALTPALNGWSG